MGETLLNAQAEVPEFQFCAHRNCGCISQMGYRCSLTGPCQPCDEKGRRFVVREWMENGTRMVSKDYLDDQNGVPLKSGNKVICRDRCMCQPENHAGGRGACGKSLGKIPYLEVQ